MDWYLQGDHPEALQGLRHEIGKYLRRHAEPDSDVGDAELIVEELVGNAVRHAGGPVWVALSWVDPQPVLTVRDLGPGFDSAILAEAASRPVGALDSGTEHLVPADVSDAPSFDYAQGGRGLFLVSHLAPSLRAAARHGQGSEVSAELPVKRAPTHSYDPPRRTVDALPRLEEAQPEGGFGRETFLRALVVQLARTVEYQHGPEGADAAVAQVGIDVGAQMEEEFRQARGIVERLAPEQLAECYVRLKHAIDGGFYVLEVSPDRVVLGNRRCPFGDVVRYAPSLCRMTSAVFGGIAARNSDEGADVTLEERIAVGDPGCRVVVDLRPASAGARPLAHHYRRPV